MSSLNWFNTDAKKETLVEKAKELKKAVEELDCPDTNAEDYLYLRAAYEFRYFANKDDFREASMALSQFAEGKWTLGKKAAILYVINKFIGEDSSMEICGTQKVSGSTKAFANAVKTINMVIRGFSRNSDEEEDVINYLMQIVRVELAASSRANFFSDKGISVADNLPRFLKLSYLGAKVCEINDETIIPTWSATKTAMAFKTLKGQAWKMSNDHKGTYCRELGILELRNGLHSAFVNWRQQGKLMADEVSLKNSISKVRTDGLYWYVRGVRANKVADVRIAILWYLMARKYGEICTIKKRHPIYDMLNKLRDDRYTEGYDNGNKRGYAAGKAYQLHKMLSRYYATGGTVEDAVRIFDVEKELATEIWDSAPSA